MVIYITTNLVNGRKYLGKDAKNRNSYLGSGKYLKMALKTYGRENFKKEIVEYCKDLTELNDREVYWLRKLQCKEDPTYYNVIDTLTPCRAGTPLTESHRKKISESRKGQKHSKEYRKKMSNLLKEIKSTLDCSHSNETKDKISKALKNKPKSAEHRQAMSNYRTGRPHLHSRKPVEQLSKTTGEVLKKYPMLTAVKENGFNPRAVQGVLSGKTKTSGGYIWRYTK